MKKLTEQTIEQMRQLVQTGAMPVETFAEVTRMIEANVDGWIASKVERLEGMISEWEATMGAEDKSFYSLGLRRAIDVVTEETAYSQLPILEKPDTPDA
jgi:hypothetical protein